MVTCQSSELGWEVTVELPENSLLIGGGSVNLYQKFQNSTLDQRRCLNTHLNLECGSKED